MDALRLVNLRSLEDTGFIDLKPITILVGQNSSGKSTFLRTFPLLRQSAEERTTGPLLWYGRYVDYGGFNASLNTKSPEKELTIGFRFTIPPRFRRGVESARISQPTSRKPKRIETLISIQNNRGKEEGFVSKVEIGIEDENKYSITLDSAGAVTSIVIDGSDLRGDLPNKLSSRHTSSNFLIPTIRFAKELDFSDLAKSVEVIGGGFGSKKSDPMDFYRFVLNLSFLPQSSSDSFDTDEFKDLVRRAESQLPEEKSQALRDYMQVSKFMATLEEVQSYISLFSRNCTYIAPVRATAERFYRPQNLSVEDVDFQGKNLAVFLRSLTAPEMKKFNIWTEKHFNFSAQVQMSGGQLSIFVKEGKIKRNLADSGFGYSQILPVITQLWSLVTSRPAPQKRGVPILFAIEQPELHLHPRVQARLADALVDAVKTSNSSGLKLRLLVETHSETIVNRLGHRVACGDIAPDELSVVVFDKNQPNEPTKVSVGEFNKEGFLNNWPYGFFEPEFEG